MPPVQKPNGQMAFGGVVAVIAVIAGVFAMTEPMGQRMDFLDSQLKELSHRMTSHEEREYRSQTKLGELHEKFREVETQFRNSAVHIQGNADSILRHQTENREERRRIDQEIAELCRAIERLATRQACLAADMVTVGGSCSID